MFWLAEKLQARLKELKELRFHHSILCKKVEVREDQGNEFNVPETLKIKKLFGKDERWSGHDEHLWLGTEIEQIDS